MPKAAHNNALRIWLTDEQIGWLEEMADESAMTNSEYLRNLVQKAMLQYNNPLFFGELK